jgi:hypothetical protein
LKIDISQNVESLLARLLAETSQFPVMMTEVFPASDLAKTDSLARSCVHEILELAEREPSIDCALRSDSNRGDRVRDRRALGADARSLLGGNRDSGRNAIQSRRYADAVHRTRSRYGLGASVGAVETNYFGANLAAFMLAIFFIGLLSFGFRLEKTAYRYASVTLTIIVLIPRTNPAWIVALHRFIEVSVGIIVALAVVAFWPERSAIPAKNAAE